MELFAYIRNVILPAVFQVTEVLDKADIVFHHYIKTPNNPEAFTSQKESYRE